MQPQSGVLTPWKRRVRSAARVAAVVALATYCAMLLLAAWRKEVRPAALDGIQSTARRTLERVGLPAGIAVFSGVGSGEWLLLGNSVRAAETRDGRAVRVLFESPASPPFLTLLSDPEDALLVTFLIQLDELRRRFNATRSPSVRNDQIRLYKALGQHFVWRSRNAGTPVRQQSILWSTRVIRFSTGETKVVPQLLLDWRRSGREIEVEAHWFPSPSWIDAVWGERANP